MHEWLVVLRCLMLIVHSSLTNPHGVINFEDFLDIDLFVQYIRRLLSDPKSLFERRSSPVFTSVPDPQVLVDNVQCLLSRFFALV